MPQVDIHNVKMQVVGRADLAPWWDEPANPALIHQAVVAARAGARRGTHATKGRSDVSGGGAKPFRQKGTGRARQGTSRAPQMRGGGTVFGPLPRGYAKAINKRMSRGALRGALAHKAAAGALVVLDEVRLEAPRTRELVEVLDRFGAVSALVVVESVGEALARAAANLEWAKVVPVSQVNVYDVLVHDKLFVTQAALGLLEGAVSP